jgi:plasmid stabilization system protein ParE
MSEYRLSPAAERDLESIWKSNHSHRFEILTTCGAKELLRARRSNVVGGGAFFYLFH